MTDLAITAPEPDTLPPEIPDDADAYIEAAKRAQALWDEAKPVRVPVSHPYLMRKGVKDPGQLRYLPGNHPAVRLKGAARQDGDVIIVQMSGLEKMENGKHQLLSLQRIYPDGTKLYLPGGRTAGTRTTIGAQFLKRGPDGSVLADQTAYVCEGWATGYTISVCAQATVFVAFSAGNLKAIAKYVRDTYVNVTLVVAADNDRWKSFNTGVDAARKAIYPPFGYVAIPDFRFLDDKPTDYNDLWLSEGEDAVRKWLDPANAKLAVTSLPAEAPPPVQHIEPAKPAPKAAKATKAAKEAKPAPEPAQAPEPPQAGTGWVETRPFRLLGHDQGHFFFLPVGGGQVIALSADKMGKVEHLSRLAPLSWWEAHFPGKGGCQTKVAADTLIQAQHAAGIYRPDNLRGRGCWRDETVDGDMGVVVHLGDRMVVPGSKGFVKPEDYESPGGYMYEHQPRMRGPARVPMALDEARDVLDVVRSLLWRNEASGDMLAGWIALAGVCGALSWRPHVFLTGLRGSGKSTVCTDIVVPLLGGDVAEGGLALYVKGESTEPGIRQKLRADAFPVVFDEAEEGEGVGARIQRILALARGASSESEARTLKGTMHGTSLDFRTRSMFCFAAIGGAVHEEADKSRVTMLALKGTSQVTKAERIAHWKLFQPRLCTINHETGRRLFTRMLSLLRSGVLPATIDVCRKVGGSVFRDQREGDQYGSLYAGAWSLQSDGVPTESEAREIMTAHNFTDLTNEAVDDGRKALAMLLEEREHVDTQHGSKTLAVGQLVDVMAGASTACTESEAKRVLDQIGLRVETRGGTTSLLVAAESAWVLRVLKGTIYGRGAKNVLLGVEGVTVDGHSTKFHGGLVARCVRIPHSLLGARDGQVTLDGV